MKNFFSLKKILNLGAKTFATIGLLLAAQFAYSHSVGQVQTTKYFAPETTQLLLNRAASGTPGLQVGDSVSYLVQFTPVDNGATIGAGGYVTDYIPAGTVVTSASFVQPDGSGGFIPDVPNLPGPMSDGWGHRNQKTFIAAPFTGLYDPRCSIAVLGKCNASIAQVYADTGIFFSTDPRTGVFTAPSADGRVRQGCTTNTPAGNGYNISPTGVGPLNTLLNQTCAATHNLWDADQTLAFGSTARPAAPTSAAVFSGNGGTGTTPFNTGSAVAGPQSGYQLDNTGNVGPWQRISISGARAGNPVGPSITDTCSQGSVSSDPNCLLPASSGNFAAIVGVPTTSGWNVSSSNPLPSSTNAVRWAVGQLVVGQLRYVKITLKLTASVPVAGLINNSEVFGGDSAEAAGKAGNDTPWRYHVPSVADNNSNLLVLKRVVCVYAGAACVPSEGSNVPANAKVRYRITYLNSSNGLQTNVVLSDVLPTQATQAGNAIIISGPNILPTTPAISTTATLTAVTAGSTITFGTIASLGGGAGGAVEYDVQTSAAVGVQISNKAILKSSQVTAGVTSFAVSNVINTAVLTVSKTTSTPSVTSGGVATYSITLTNTGAANATQINVYDFLPTSGGTVSNAATRFTYTSTTSVTVLTTVAPTVLVPPNQAPYSSNLNQQQVLWNFAAQTLAPGASAVITFNAAVGASMPASSVPYTNDARVIYSNGTTTVSDDLTAAAPISVTSPLTLNKTIDCVYNPGGTACNAYDGNGLIPLNAKVRYKLAYQNTGASTHTNVQLCDSLPTQVVAFTSVTTPSIAPTPTGAFADAPVIGARTSPASAACGFSGGTTFSYPLIASLAPNVGGVVFFDVQTNAASGATVTNTGKIVSTQAPGGVTSIVSATAYDTPIINISKSASTGTVSPSGTLSYTITVSNTGTSPANAIKVYDFLPFSGTTANAATRFNYVATGTIAGLTSVGPTTAVAPTVTPYSSNINQQQVLWDFGAQSLAPGATATIFFTVTVGASVPVSVTPYGNSARVVYSVGSAEVTSQAPVTVSSPLQISKTIDCVYNGAGTACNAYDGGGIVPVNAKVRYKISYQNAGTTAQTNVFICDQLPTQIASIASVTTPTITPTPTGPFADAPVIGARTSPANATCGLSGGTSFSYPVIASLAPGTGGVIFFDVLTNAASGAIVTNTGKAVSTELPGGVTSGVSATALAVPILQMTKTVSSSGISPGGTATYTLIVTNTSTIAASAIKVYDFLPTSGGTTSDATKRFAYGTTVSIAGLTGIAPTTSMPPTQSPYSVNANQQQVLWDFGVQTLAAGANFNIMFTAIAGTAMPGGASYTNYAQVISNNPSVVTASASAPIALGATLSGRVFEDVNYGGGSGRACGATAGSPTCGATSGAIGRAGARVELYDSIGYFVGFATTDPNGDYSFAGLASANYSVRVVNNTVTSSRTGYVAGLLTVQTFRTNGLTGTVGTPDPNRVGGEVPCASDATANTTNATLASLTPGFGSGVCASQPANAPESLTTVAIGGSNITGIDFGFNFDTIVNAKDSGQGSLRQFILNSNALGNAGLAQTGQTAGREVSLFMIADGQAHNGLRAGLVNQLTGGVAVITPVTALPQITDANTTIDGTTQTTNVGDNNSGALGTGGTVGIGPDGRPNTGDEKILPVVNRPEVQINGVSTIVAGLDVQASNTTIRGLSIYGFGSGPQAGNIRVGTSVASAFTATLIEQNILGTPASSFTDPGATRTKGSNIVALGADGGTVKNNLSGFAESFGFLMINAADNWTVEYNEFRGNGINNANRDGVSMEDSSTGETIRYNLITANQGVGVDSYQSLGNNTIRENTIASNGIGVSANLENAGVRLFGNGSTVINNLIQNNAGAGVLVLGQSAGLTNTPALKNKITQNSFSGNGSNAIDLSNAAAAGSIVPRLGDGITLNSGAVSTCGYLGTSGNNGIDFPIITAATVSGGLLNVSGTACPVSTVEFYKAAVASGDTSAPNNYGEGIVYLGSLVTNAAGVFNGSFAVAGGIINVGDAVTSIAIAIDNTNNTSDNTSEFSGNLTAVLSGVNVSGFVYSDVNQNSVKDATEAGTGLTLFAKLIPAATPLGPAIQAIAVNSTTGAYSFSGVTPGQYSIVIDNNNTLADVAPNLPAGAIGTEFPTQVRTPFLVGSTDIANLNFGLVITAGISGRAFNDNGATGGIANNGIQDGGEQGISGVTVKLTDAAGTTAYATTATDNNGNYFLVVPTTVPAGTVLKVVESNLSGFTSTGGQVGNTAGSYALAPDTTTFTLVANSVYTNVNFADVPNNTFTPNGAQSSLPGNAVFYPHTFAAGTAGTVMFTSSNISTPATTGWNTLIYQDANCNGVIDTAEANALVSAPIAVVAGQTVCIVVKENIPANAPYNGQDQITVNAQFSYANAASLVIAPLVRQDLTTIGAAAGTGLVLQKAVRNITAGTALGTSNQGKSADLLEYVVTYNNSSGGTLTSVVINDTTPAFTVFDAATCGAPILCTIAPAPAVGGAGPIQWTLSAPLPAGGTGTVTFTVRIQ